MTSMPTPRRVSLPSAAVLTVAFAPSCAAEDPSASARPSAVSSTGAPSTSPATPMATAPASPALSPSASSDPSLISGDDPPPTPTPVSSSTAEACASETTSAELEPVILAFAFDVSGSMGKGDEPYHDRSLKWDPVVAATKAFFADPDSAGLSASLTFFPIDSDDKCEGSSYAEPVVPLTALPSPAFAQAIDDETPESEDDWIGGTPTWPVLEGTRGFLESSIAAHPEARHAIVLVTDGHPQSCDDELDDIEAVADYVATFADTIPTYVIGVANPATEEEPDPPDVVTNLHLIAEHGNTGTAFLIDTGNAAQTAADFASAIDAIRGNSLSCTLTIPAPPSGQVLDTELVNVTYDGGSGPVALVYSEDCSLPDAWHYDDAANPSTILLCDTTCTTVLADVTARIDVEFGCVRRTTPGVAR